MISTKEIRNYYILSDKYELSIMQLLKLTDIRLSMFGRRFNLHIPLLFIL